MRQTVEEASLRNLRWIGTSDVFSRALAFVAFIYVARTLGPESVGIVGLGFAVASLFTPLIDFGLGFIGGREVSKTPEASGAIIRSVIRVRLLLAIVSGVLTAIIGTILYEAGVERNIILLSALTFIPAILTLSWAYPALDRPAWFFFEKVSQSLLYIAAVAAFIHRPEDALAVPIAYTISAAVPLILTTVHFLRLHPVSGSVNTALSPRGLVRSAASPFVSMILSSISIPVGVLILSRMSTLEETGYFSLASRVVILSSIIPNALWSSYYPSISRAVRHDARAIPALMRSLFARASLFTGIVTVIGIVLPYSVLGFLFGGEFEPAGPAFMISCCVAGLQSITIVATRIMPAFDKQDVFRRSMMYGVTAQVFLSVILVPQYGAVGAAASFVAAELVILAFCIRSFISTGSRIGESPDQTRFSVHRVLLAPSKRIVDRVFFWLCRRIFSRGTGSKDIMLVVRTDGIGDLLYFMQYVLSIRRQHNGRRIVLCCREESAPFARQAHLFDHVVSFDTLSIRRNYFTRWKLMRSLQRIGAELAMNMTYHREQIGDEMTILSGASYTVAMSGNDECIHPWMRMRNDRLYSHVVPVPDHTSEAERYRTLFDAIGMSVALSPVTLHGTKPDKVNNMGGTEHIILNYESEYVVVAPGGSAAIRRWPESRYAELLDRLPSRYSVVLLGSSEESVLLERLRQASNRECIAATQLSAASVVDVVRNAQLVVGNDSAPVHLAAILAVPAICILGGGHFSRYFPYASVSVVHERIECYECNWRCHHPEPYCLTRIRTETIINEVNRMLSR